MNVDEIRREIKGLHELTDQAEGEGEREICITVALVPLLALGLRTLIEELHGAEAEAALDDTEYHQSRERVGILLAELAALKGDAE